MCGLHTLRGWLVKTLQPYNPELQTTFDGGEG